MVECQPPVERKRNRILAPISKQTQNSFQKWIINFKTISESLNWWNIVLGDEVLGQWETVDKGNWGFLFETELNNTKFSLKYIWEMWKNIEVPER